jgi:Ser-tRNA(Ala) deacylase AlaX
MSQTQTTPLWLTDTELYAYEGASLITLASSSSPALGPVMMILNATIGHPQGGGQPGDKGLIIIGNTDGVFVFCTTRWGVVAPLDSSVIHYGWLLDEEAAALARADPVVIADLIGDSSPPHGALTGEACSAAIDALTLNTTSSTGVIVHVARGWRRACAKLHSAGHLLDAAVSRALPSLISSLLPVGETAPTLSAGKGNHFPGGAASVEYVGSRTGSILAAFSSAVSASITHIISEGARTRVALLPTKSDLPSALVNNENELDGMDSSATAALDLTHFPSNKPLRLVAVGGVDNVCPCGGTHVKHVSELKGLTITKVTSKKGLTKISYTFEVAAA